MLAYNQKIINAYQANRNIEQALPMAAYMKDNFAFFGIKSPERKEINKVFFKENGLPAYSELRNIVVELYEQPQRELHYFAQELVFKCKKQWQSDLLDLLELMLIGNAWWDTVDFIASTLVGNFFTKFPELMLEKTAEWNASPNFWLIRTSIIFQLKYRKKTNQDLLLAYILPHCHQKEFFIQKAIGWALREYSKTDARFVKGFVEATPELAALSKREALRLIV